MWWLCDGRTPNPTDVGCVTADRLKARRGPVRAGVTRMIRLKCRRSFELRSAGLSLCQFLSFPHDWLYRPTFAPRPAPPLISHLCVRVFYVLSVCVCMCMSRQSFVSDLPLVSCPTLFTSWLMIGIYVYDVCIRRIR